MSQNTVSDKIVIELSQEEQELLATRGDMRERAAILKAKRQTYVGETEQSLIELHEIERQRHAYDTIALSIERQLAFILNKKLSGLVDINIVNLHTPPLGQHTIY